MKIYRLAITFGMLLGGMTLANATIVGFSNLGDSNAAVPTDLASFATTDGNGYTVSNGITPNIYVNWDTEWDIHTSTYFQALEDWQSGGTPWDIQSTGDRRIGQLDGNTHTINFFADSGYALVLNSFDFGQTGENDGTTIWDVTLTADSSSEVVWSQEVTFVSSGGTGQVYTITPDFTGIGGEGYTLMFVRQESTYGNGRVGIDNLSFNQVVAVPEPGSIALLGVAGAGLAFFARRRRS